MVFPEKSFLTTAFMHICHSVHSHMHNSITSFLRLLSRFKPQKKEENSLESEIQAINYRILFLA